MKRLMLIFCTSMFLGFFMASLAGAGFVSEVGNMVKEDVKQAAAQEGKKVVDKSVEHAKAKALNATTENSGAAIEKVQKANEIKNKAEETKHSVEKMHEMGTNEIKKWKD